MAYANILFPFIFNVQISQKTLLRRLKTKLNLNTTKWDKEERKKKDLVINMHVVVVVVFSRFPLAFAYLVSISCFCHYDPRINLCTNLLSSRKNHSTINWWKRWYLCYQWGGYNSPKVISGKFHSNSGITFRDGRTKISLFRQPFWTWSGKIAFGFV